MCSRQNIALFVNHTVWQAWLVHLREMTLNVILITDAVQNEFYTYLYRLEQVMLACSFSVFSKVLQQPADGRVFPPGAARFHATIMLLAVGLARYA